jgi:hypothetical protein
MGKKKLTTMRLDENLVKDAHELGWNVTKVCENALKSAIEHLKPVYYHNNCKTGLILLKKLAWWGRPDLNRSPESPSLRAWTKLADGPSLSAEAEKPPDSAI